MHVPRFDFTGQPLIKLRPDIVPITRSKIAAPFLQVIGVLLARGETVVPLVGARRRDRLTEALGALDVRLDAATLARIEQAVPRGAAAGERYAAQQMAMLDSERKTGGGR